MVEQARTVTVAPPMTKYEEVVGDPNLFITSLQKLHSVMGTKFMIPIIGGRDLDLHKLFVEVTSRGGIEKIVREKRWKEVTSTFNFPCTVTNASFVLSKYYCSLLQHFELIYYFKNKDYGPSSTDALQGSKALPAQAQSPSVENRKDFVLRDATSSVGTPVIGVIDGKFENGYLVTVRLGKDTLKGVLYQVPPAQLNQVPLPSNLSTDSPTNGTPKSRLSRRRKRRKKSELRKRDPSYPKPNRSGYNFFFAEQHARLRLGKDRACREISRKIGELWNNLGDNEKAVYQEQAVKDKERYKTEMENYKEKLNENQVISDAEPLQQRFPCFHVNMAVANVEDGEETNFSVIVEDDSDSSESETDDEDDGDMIE